MALYHYNKENSHAADRLDDTPIVTTFQKIIRGQALHFSSK
jgi:hypothetical protein